MKHLHYLFVILLCFILQNATAQESWTFYSNSHYKGSNKEYTKGVSGLDLGSGRFQKNSELRVNNQWKWNSWKSDCCIKFYYYTRHGKVSTKTLCGDVRDFTSELKKWNDLKYGYQSGWKNIQKVNLNCDKKYASKNNGHYNNNQNNNHNNGQYNNRNNRNNYNNRNQNNRNNHNRYNANNDHKGKNDYKAKNDYSKYDWYKYYGKGNVIFTSDYHFDGQYKARASGSHDYRSLRFYPRAVLVAKSGRYLIVEYRDQHNRRKSFKLKEDVSDLRKYMASNLRLDDKYKAEPYKAITKFTIMRY